MGRSTIFKFKFAGPKITDCLIIYLIFFDVLKQEHVEDKTPNQELERKTPTTCPQTKTGWLEAERYSNRSRCQPCGCLPMDQEEEGRGRQRLACSSSHRQAS